MTAVSAQAATGQRLSLSNRPTLRSGNLLRMDVNQQLLEKSMRHWLLASIGLVVIATSSSAQDRLKTYPGYERYARMSREIQTSVQPGALQVTWIDTTHFEYT